ncbi:MAG: hypothetical protein PHU14_06205 [Methylovulum sp.]|nr:hypothetical protein [Methylovulum sp.]
MNTLKSNPLYLFSCLPLLLLLLFIGVGLASDEGVDGGAILRHLAHFNDPQTPAPVSEDASVKK